MQVQAEQDALTAFYHRRHPEYLGSLAHWRFCEQCYSGGRDWFEQNIFKYLKEGDTEFADRKKRAYRFNHTREAVDLVQKYLFKASIMRNVEDAPDILKDFWKKATRSGQNIDSLVRLAGTKNSLVGRIAVVVDSSLRSHKVEAEDAAAPTPLSVKEAEELGGSVYAYIVTAPDILDYAWSDEDGELLWIKLREYVRDDKDFLNGTGIVTERVRVWTRDEWILMEQDLNEKTKEGYTKAREIDRGKHDLGRVPVKLCDHTQTEQPYSAPGLVDDIAYLDRAVANYLSNLDAIIQDQTFSQLVIPVQALPSDKKGARDQVLEIGTKRIFTYDGGAGSTAKPEFISPDVKQAGVILNVINKIINEIYSTIGLAGERTKQDNAVGIDNSSGVAKAYDFERVNALLASKAARLEELENWIVETVLLWSGVTTLPSEPMVTYPKTFDVASLSDELVTAEALQKVAAPIEVRREQMRSIVDKLMPQVTDEVYGTLMSAVDKWEDIEEATARANIEATKASAEASKERAKAANEKPVAAPNRQGSVTAGT